MLDCRQLYVSGGYLQEESYGQLCLYLASAAQPQPPVYKFGIGEPRNLNIVSS